MMLRVASRGVSRAVAQQSRRCSTAKAVPRNISVKKQESRHLHEDGRSSLKKHILGNNPVTEVTANLKKETFPLVACIGGAIVLVAVTAGYFLTKSPDVKIAKSNRQAGMPDASKVKEAENWASHKQSLARSTAGGEKISHEKLGGK